MRIQAGLVSAPFEGRIADLEAEDPGPSEVVLRTEFSFVSNGTEQHAHRREFPEPPASFPMAMGYQCVGRIEWMGAAVTGLALGQRVFARRNNLLGVSNPLGGVHSRHVVTAAASLVPLPEDLDPLEASALVIAQVGYNTAWRFQSAPGQTALVIGDGLIGQFTAQALSSRGFSVFLAGHHRYRLELAKAACNALGVTLAAPPELDRSLSDLTGGRVDLAVDSVGSPDTLALCLKLVRPMGQIAVSGFQGGRQALNIHRAFEGEFTFHFPAGATRDRLMATAELLRVGELRVAPLVTHTFAGSEFGEVCRLLGSRNTEYLGLALDWRRS